MIRILTDSASDILPAEAEQLGVTVIPLNVTLEDGVVLRDGIDMTPSAYYDHLASCRKLPTTSQPSPELFEKLSLIHIWSPHSLWPFSAEISFLCSCSGNDCGHFRNTFSREGAGEETSMFFAFLQFFEIHA